MSVVGKLVDSTLNQIDQQTFFLLFLFFLLLPSGLVLEGLPGFLPSTLTENQAVLPVDT